MSSKVYIETFGCQMNVADTERAATGLRKAGYELTASAETADVVLLNTCSVRERAERKVFRRVGEIRKLSTPTRKRPIIGVMGCVAQLEGEKIFKSLSAVDLVVGTQATDRISSLIERAQSGERAIIDLDDRQENEVWDVSPAERRSPYVAFVPIIEGCNKFCSFCIVPYSRGREKSRSAAEIVNEVLKASQPWLQRSSSHRTKREQLSAHGRWKVWKAMRAPLLSRVCFALLQTPEWNESNLRHRFLETSILI